MERTFDQNLNAKGETPMEFDEPKQRKILATVINNRQWDKLDSCGWRLAENGWKETLNKLDSLQQLIDQDAKAKMEEDIEIAKTMITMKIPVVQIKHHKETVKIVVRTIQVNAENY